MNIGIIPARLNSTRLPRKMLLAETGKPLIQHTWENAKRFKKWDELFILTDDKELADACLSFGASPVLTPSANSGTERIYWFMSRFRKLIGLSDVVVGIQGDEPEIEPDCFEILLSKFKKERDRRTESEVETLVTPLINYDEVLDHSVVKVLLDGQDKALMFTRQPCHARNRHIGIYAYRVDSLFWWMKQEPTYLEKSENLEQMRVLESGGRIHCNVVPSSPIGIDTRHDYDLFKERMSQTNSTPLGNGNPNVIPENP